MITSRQALARYGSPLHEKNMILWDVPSVMERSCIPGRIYVNADMQPALAQAIVNLITRGFIGELKTWDGCVSGDTEYFNGVGWSPIASYQSGKVGQVDEDGVLSMVTPERFIATPCDAFVRVQSAQGVSQVVSYDHRVIYIDGRGNEQIVFAGDILAEYKKHPHKKIKIPTTYITNASGIDYSDAYIRLKTAVFADGCFPHKHRETKINYCKVLLRKQRKIDRLGRLLVEADVAFKRSVNCRGETTFYFYMDNKDKHFDATWYACSSEQLRAVCDEVKYWDSSVDNGRFFSTDSRDVDFIQYARGACGVRSKVVQTREGSGVQKTCYAATLSLNTTPAVATDGAGITHITVPGGMKYCFTVPTGRLLLRHNGHVFITGNCFNIRSSRGGASASLHSWGLAVDVNAAWNSYGQRATLSEGFVQCWKDAGFDWGGDWETCPDGMHFQLARWPE
jgi:hypothetical protein